jgi:hypothetical protein
VGNQLDRPIEVVIVLSDSERRRLTEIESWFEANDRRLARRFAQLRTPKGRGRVMLASASFVLLLAAVAVVARVASDAATSLVPVVMVGALLFSWWAHRQPVERALPPIA